MPIFQNFQNILKKIGFYGVKSVVFIGFFGCEKHFYATFGPRCRSADFGLGELGIAAVYDVIKAGCDIVFFGAEIVVNIIRSDIVGLHSIVRDIYALAVLIVEAYRQEHILKRVIIVLVILIPAFSVVWIHKHVHPVRFSIGYATYMLDIGKRPEPVQ